MGAASSSQPSLERKRYDTHTSLRAPKTLNRLHGRAVAQQEQQASRKQPERAQASRAGAPQNAAPAAAAAAGVAGVDSPAPPAAPPLAVLRMARISLKEGRRAGSQSVQLCTRPCSSSGAAGRGAGLVSAHADRAPCSRALGAAGQDHKEHASRRAGRLSSRKKAHHERLHDLAALGRERLWQRNGRQAHRLRLQEPLQQAQQAAAGWGTQHGTKPSAAHDCSCLLRSTSPSQPAQEGRTPLPALQHPTEPQEARPCPAPQHTADSQRLMLSPQPPAPRGTPAPPPPPPGAHPGLKRH